MGLPIWFAPPVYICARVMLVHVEEQRVSAFLETVLTATTYSQGHKHDGIIRERGRTNIASAWYRKNPITPV